MTDDQPYVDGIKTAPALLAAAANRDRIPEGAILVPGATYELYTADDIYSLDGTLLAAADTLLATATTGEDGLAHFPWMCPSAAKTTAAAMPTTGRPTAAGTTSARWQCRTAT